MANEIAKPSMPGSASLVEREANRIVSPHATLVDEVDAVIKEIMSDEALIEEWARHNDPIFDKESGEGSVDIDKVRLADMVREQASKSGERYPLIREALTSDLKSAVQYAQRRTGESVNQRRTKAKAA